MLTFLPRLLRPSREGTLCLHPLEGVPGAFVSNASSVSRALLVLCVNQGISASFSLLLSYHRLRTTRFWSTKGPQQWWSHDLHYYYFLFFWLHRVLIAACGIVCPYCSSMRAVFSCGMWDLDCPDQGWNPGPLHWEHRVLAPPRPFRIPPSGQ